MRKVHTEDQKRVRRATALIATVLIGLAAVAAITWSLVLVTTDQNQTQPSGLTPGESQTPPATPSNAPSGPRGEVVDPTVTEQGLVPQPITSDLKQYAIEAAKAIVTVDSTKINRKQFRNYISSWLGYDQRYGPDLAELDRMRQVRSDEISKRIIGDSTWWELHARDDSVMVGEATGMVKMDYDHISIAPGSLEDTNGIGIHTVTVELAVTTTAAQGGKPIKVVDTLRLTMQIQCDGSYPVPPTPQVSGDCKVIRYFPEVFN